MAASRLLRAVALLCAAAHAHVHGFGVVTQQAALRPFVALRRGRCSAPVTTIAECEQAAHVLQMRDTTVTLDNKASTKVTYDPPGCYVEGGSLKFNSKQTNDGDCNGQDVCLCELTFELRTSGRCESPVTTLQECSEAGRSFVTDSNRTVAAVDPQTGATDDPPGCYYEGNRLKFNQGGNKGPCSQADVCVCKQQTDVFDTFHYKDLGLGDCLPDLSNYANQLRAVNNVSCRAICTETPSCLAYSDDKHTCRIYSNEDASAAITKLAPSRTWKKQPKCTISRENCEGSEITSAVGSSAAGTRCYKRIGSMLKCASEGGQCTCDGNVKYGVGSRWSKLKHVNGAIQCTNTVFGDPAPGAVKECQCQSNGDVALQVCKPMVRSMACSNTTGRAAVDIPLDDYTRQNCEAACEARAQAQSGCCETNPKGSAGAPFCRFTQVGSSKVGGGPRTHWAGLCVAGANTGPTHTPAGLVVGTPGANSCPAGTVKLSQAECRDSMGKLGLGAGAGVNGKLNNPKDPGGCFKFSWGGNGYAYYNDNAGVGRANRFVVCKKPPATACAMWRQTGGCAQDGVREPGNDKPCASKIQAGWSGYCECENGRKAFGQACAKHKPFTCAAACATGASVDRACKTLRGTGNAQGAACVFPFEYKDHRGQVKKYSGCTAVDNGAALWCATTANYTKDQKFGNCPAVGCAGHANVSLVPPPPPAAHSTCQTTGGSGANSAPCVFPFTYKGVQYESCSAIDNGGTLWCATTSNYDTDGLWGNCPQAGCVKEAVPTKAPTAPRKPASQCVCDLFHKQGLCDWKHWSAMYSKCNLQALHLDSDREKAQVKAGDCSWAGCTKKRLVAGRPCTKWVVTHNSCFRGEEPEGQICANRNSATESYCSYTISPTACARCVTEGVSDGTAQRASAGCPAQFPVLSKGLVPGKICWDSAGEDKDGAGCGDWCMLPQFAAANPGGHLSNCPGNLCKPPPGANQN